MEKHLETEKLLTRKEAADFLGVSEGTLAVWASTKRYDKGGPPCKVQVQ